MLLSLLVISFLYLQRHGYIHAEGYTVLQWLQTYSHIARDNLGWLRLVNVLAYDLLYQWLYCTNP